MSTPLIIISTLIYLGVAVDQFMKGAIGPGIMFLGYTVGKCGILLTVR
jgi:hypothetical protein